MTRFVAHTRIGRPLDEVYLAYRDHFDAVARDAENVAHVAVFGGEPRPGGWFTRHRWHGRVQLPLTARMFLSPDMLVWDAEVTWHDATRTCDWTIRALHFTEHVRCGGRVLLRPIGSDATQATLEGELCIDPRGVRFIPARMHAVVSARIEKFIIDRVPANFTAVGDHVTRGLHAATRSAPGATRGTSPIVMLPPLECASQIMYAASAGLPRAEPLL